MSKVAFIGDERLAIFLSNFDIETFISKSGKEAKERMTEILKEGKYILILTSEEYFSFLREIFEKRKESLPVILMLPSYKESGISVKFIRNIVEKAVGIDILSKKQKLKE